MALMTRLSRLLRADLHAILDRLEAPDLVLTQALRDMEEVQRRDLQDLNRLERQQLRQQDLSDELARRLDQDAMALEDCLAADQDELARAVIRRRLESERMLARLEQARRKTTQAIIRQRATLSEQEARLRDLRARAEVAAADPEQNPEDDETGWDLADGSVTIRDADVEVALLQARRQREASA